MSTLNHSTIERGLSPSALANRIRPSFCNRIPTSSALDLAARLIEDPAISFWLQKNLALCLTRDLCDTINDVELLLSVLTARLEELNEGGAK